MLYPTPPLLEGVPFANGAPNLAVDTPVLRQHATAHNIPISGNLKTDPTLVMTVLAPMHMACVLDCGISGWLGYPMQRKVGFPCRNSILAVPQ